MDIPVFVPDEWNGFWFRANFPLKNYMSLRNTVLEKYNRILIGSNRAPITEVEWNHPLWDRHSMGRFERWFSFREDVIQHYLGELASIRIALRHGAAQEYGGIHYTMDPQAISLLQNAEGKVEIAGQQADTVHDMGINPDLFSTVSAFRQAPEKVSVAFDAIAIAGLAVAVASLSVAIVQAHSAEVAAAAQKTREAINTYSEYVKEYAKEKQLTVNASMAEDMTLNLRRIITTSLPAVADQVACTHSWNDAGMQNGQVAQAAFNKAMGVVFKIVNNNSCCAKSVYIDGQGLKIWNMSVAIDSDSQFVGIRMDSLGRIQICDKSNIYVTDSWQDLIIDEDKMLMCNVPTSGASSPGKRTGCWLNILKSMPAYAAAAGHNGAEERKTLQMPLAVLLWIITVEEEYEDRCPLFTVAMNGVLHCVSNNFPGLGKLKNSIKKRRRPGGDKAHSEEYVVAVGEHSTIEIG